MTTLRKHRGFTLLELVMVMIIIGLLAVIATPRFMGLSREAHIASLKQARAAVVTTMQLFHSKTLTLGIEKQSVPLALDGVGYWNHWGYPHVRNNARDRPGIIVLAGIKPDEYHLQYEDVISHTGTDKVKISPKGTPTPSRCYVAYLQAVDANTPPVLTEDFSGC
ncbi:type II secretion system protein [Shewanella sp. YIC-542]|uniref:type II secretion system protein n=1 Tax=Shewanella mytili TaxID=3377111 RepID=UPI00398ED51C